VPLLLLKAPRTPWSSGRAARSAASAAKPWRSSWWSSGGRTWTAWTTPVHKRKFCRTQTRRTVAASIARAGPPSHWAPPWCSSVPMVAAMPCRRSRIRFVKGWRYGVLLVPYAATPRVPS